MSNQSEKKTPKALLKEKIQGMVNHHPQCCPGMKVSMEQLFSAMGKEKFFGIHDVTAEPEWISPKGLWAMRIPVGFSYTMDITETTSLNEGVLCDAQIQITGHTNFGSFEYSDPFNLMIFPSYGVVECRDDFSDLSSINAMSAIIQKLNQIETAEGWTKKKHSTELAVYYTAQKIRQGKGYTYRVLFLVFCSGTTQITAGLACIDGALYTDNMFELCEDIMMSITKMPQTRNMDQFIPNVLPSDFKLTFDKGVTMQAPDGITIGIPDHFKGTNNKEAIGGRLLSIVNEQYEFWDGTGDNNSIPLDFSMMDMSTGDVPTSPSVSGALAKQIINNIAQYDILDPEGALYLAKATQEGVIFFQQLSDYGDMKGLALRALAIMNKRVKILTVRMQIQTEIPKQYYNLLLYEAGELAIAFFRHFSLKGLDCYDYGISKTKELIPVPKPVFGLS